MLWVTSYGFSITDGCVGSSDFTWWHSETDSSQALQCFCFPVCRSVYCKSIKVWANLLWIKILFTSSCEPTLFHDWWINTICSVIWVSELIGDGTQKIYYKLSHHKFKCSTVYNNATKHIVILMCWQVEISFLLEYFVMLSQKNGIFIQYVCVFKVAPTWHRTRNCLKLFWTIYTVRRKSPSPEKWF